MAILKVAGSKPYEVGVFAHIKKILSYTRKLRAMNPALVGWI